MANAVLVIPTARITIKITFSGLGIFYAVFLFALIKYSFGPILTLAVLLAGHLVAVTFLVLYILYRAARDT